jgi:acyl-CoA synthetase (NDP forming)
MSRIGAIGKPIVCCAAGGEYTDQASRRLESRGISVFQTAEKAVAAAHALVEQGFVSRRGQ